MNFDLTEEQRLLQESLQGWLARNYDFGVRKAAAADGSVRANVWGRLASELGLFGAALSEEDGGFGGGPVETLVIAEEIGRALLLEPYQECVVAAGALLRGSDSGEARDLLARLIEGAELVVPALYERQGRFDYSRIDTRAAPSGVDDVNLVGAKAVVSAAPLAGWFIVSARDERAEGRIGLFLVRADAAGLSQRRYRLIDGRPAADLTFEGVPARRIVDASAACALIEEATAQGIAALCAEAVGLMDWMLRATVDYARQREQFGRPIADFQAIQHKIADMLGMVERSRSITIMATLSLDLPPRERDRAVSAAKVFVDQALQEVSEAAIQVHGGIGTTDELAVSHYFKRARTMLSLLGDRSFHLRRMAETI